jgi:hypothetical protein
MTFDAAVADTANFSGLTLADLTAFSYTWDNGTGTRTIGRPDITFANNTLSAVGGVLSNFVLSDFPFNSFAITVAPSTVSSVGVSENSSVGPIGASFVDRDQGAWRLQVAPVPEPGTLALLLGGLGALFGWRVLGSRRNQV